MRPASVFPWGLVWVRFNQNKIARRVMEVESGTKMEEEEDERREAVIASAASLQSNFKPKSGVTSAQLSKFQELHKRRLQLKARSKHKKKTKGLVDGTGKSPQEDSYAKKYVDVKSSARNEDSSSSFSRDVPSVQQEKGGDRLVPKKRQKLHWGLDAKERWEMKANM